MMSRNIKFRPTDPNGFYATVRKRVDAYLSQQNQPRQGDYRLWIKSICLMMISMSLYIIILSNVFGVWGYLIAFSLLGISTCLICMNIIHDALHGAFFKDQKRNRLLGYFFDLQGMSSYVWSVSHNFEHHTYTNIAGFDHDINKMIVLRLAPTDEYYAFHRYQHLYALPLYTLTTLSWIYLGDISSFIKAIKERRVNFKEIFLFFFFKCVFMTIFIFIPLLVVQLPWWQVLLGFVAMQAVGGALAAIVFQLAHVVEEVDYPLPNAEGQMQERWAIHQMKTTSNFATHNWWITHLFGGLNFQIEHHLFPHISHVHYYDISKIVKQTAKEFQLPYYEKPTFFAAVLSHLRILKKLGQAPI